MTTLKQLANKQWFAVLVLVIGILIIWYIAALLMNGNQMINMLERTGQSWTYAQILEGAYSIQRPPLPVPHQVAYELYDSIFNNAITSRRSLLYHTQITLNSTLLGFVLGSLLGIVIAIGIVHNRTLDTSLMPWVIASQTVPILAIAPIVVVVLGSMNLTGILPKAIISMYLSFFPVVIGMVKGLRSADKLHTELMITYSASTQQMFWKLRWFSAQPYLFASLKIGIAAALVGAIVAELPTGAQGGLGARLLSGSYYGQTVQIWSALVMSALLGWVLITLVGLAERFILLRRGLS